MVHISIPPVETDAVVVGFTVALESYMAPEIIEARPYKGTSVDIFALGVTLFAMVTGVMPFERRAHKDND